MRACRRHRVSPTKPVLASETPGCKIGLVCWWAPVQGSAMGRRRLAESEAARGINVHCPACGRAEVDTTDAVEVQAFEADDDRWVLTGRMQLRYCVHGRCRNCGNAYDIVSKDIPVQYSSLPCPRCDKRDHLACKV